MLSFIRGAAATPFQLFGLCTRVTICQLNVIRAKRRLLSVVRLPSSELMRPLHTHKGKTGVCFEFVSAVSQNSDHLRVRNAAGEDVCYRDQYSFLHTHTAGVLTCLCNSIGALLISHSTLTPSSSSERREESLLAHLLLRCDG